MLLAYYQGKLDKEDIKKHKVKLISEISSFSLKGDEELKNIRKRSDGRYEWRKQINHISYQKINKNKKELEKQVRSILKKITVPLDKQVGKTFINIAWEWFKNNKQDIKTSDKYTNYIKNRFEPNPIFTQAINKITYEQLQHFINSIKEHRVASYCYFIIKGTFKEALKLDMVKKDISILINKPKNKTIKGEHFSFVEQKTIVENLEKTPIKYEILFYLLTGCRRNEGLDLKEKDINYEKLTIFVNGTKSTSAKRYIPISKEFAKVLHNNFKNMFIHKEHYYNKHFKDYIESLGITGKSLHSLRHTFNTNLYYLGVKDKERQYYLGHSSIVITNDIYTHLDPTITKSDILNLYKDLYPKF